MAKERPVRQYLFRTGKEVVKLILMIFEGHSDFTNNEKLEGLKFPLKN